MISEKVSLFWQETIKLVVEKSVTGLFIIGFGAMSALATTWYHKAEVNKKQAEINIDIPKAIQAVALSAYQSGEMNCFLKKRKDSWKH